MRSIALLAFWLLWPSCGGAISETPPTGDGDAALSALSAEAKGLADAAIAGAEIRGVMFSVAAFDKAAVFREGPRPDGRVRWTVAYIEVEAVLAAGRKAEFVLVATASGARVSEGRLRPRESSRPSASARAPVQVQRAVAAARTAAKRDGWAVLELRRKDLAALPNDVAQSMIENLRKDDPLFRESFLEAPQATVIGLGAVGLVGVDAKGAVYAAETTLAGRGGGFEWHPGADSDKALFRVTRLGGTIPWDRDLAAMCALARTALEAPLSQRERHKLFADSVRASDVAAELKALLQGIGEQVLVNMEFFREEILGLGGPRWLCPAMEALFPSPSTGS